MALVAAMRYLTLSALVSFLLAGVGFGQTTTGQHSAEFRATVTRSVQMKYLLFLPDDYQGNGAKKWPLIMYLHGGSRRGDDIERLKEPGFGLPAADELAPIGGHKELIDALRALGNQVRFTALPGRDHFILDTYEKEELYSWFLEHSLSVKTGQ